MVVEEANKQIVVVDSDSYQQTIIDNRDMKEYLTKNIRTIRGAINQVEGYDGSSYGGKRDLYKILGYLTDPGFSDYVKKYERQDVTQRIINAYPEAIWSDQPTVTDDEKKEDLSPFEEAFAKFARKTRLFHYIMRLDKLAGLGRYSVLLMGVRDGASDMSLPMGSVNGPDGFIYYRPYSEGNVQIVKYEENIADPRYGLPVMYRLSTGGYGDTGGGSQMPLREVDVHYTRIVHVAEGTLENDIFGVPRLRPVINRLMDLEKVIGGGSEIFWINGRGGLSINAAKDTDVKDPEALKVHAENYVNQLDRILRTKGMDIKTLDMNVHDPDQHVSVILDLISGATGIPKRILIGSERGELASSQDEKNWWTRVIERRNNFCEPVIFRPIIDQLIRVKVLPEPKDGEYELKWPILGESSPMEKADIAMKKTKALRDFAEGNGTDQVITKEQFVTEILEMEFKQTDIDKLLNDEDFQKKEDEKFGRGDALPDPAAGGGDGPSD